MAGVASLQRKNPKTLISHRRCRCIAQSYIRSKWKSLRRIPDPFRTGLLRHGREGGGHDLCQTRIDRVPAHDNVHLTRTRDDRLAAGHVGKPGDGGLAHRNGRLGGDRYGRGSRDVVLHTAVVINRLPQSLLLPFEFFVLALELFLTILEAFDLDL